MTVVAKEVMIFSSEPVICFIYTLIPNFLILDIRIKEYVFMSLTESHVVNTDVVGTRKVMNFPIRSELINSYLRADPSVSYERENI